VSKAAILSLVALTLAAPSPARAEDNDALLRALGGATAAYLYEAHQKVGIVADARAKKLYEPEVCDKELQVTLNILKVVDKQMADLVKSDISADEKKTVRSIRAIAAKQIKSAEGLKAYWEGKDKDDLETYTTSRAEGWTDLKKLMGLKDNPGGVKPKTED